VALDAHEEELLEQLLHQRHAEDAAGERRDHRRAHAFERRLGGEDADEGGVVVADDVAAEAVEAAAREALVTGEVAGVEAPFLLEDRRHVVGGARRGGERHVHAGREHRIEEAGRVAHRHPAVAGEAAQPVREVGERVHGLDALGAGEAARHLGRGGEQFLVERF